MPTPYCVATYFFKFCHKTKIQLNYLFEIFKFYLIITFITVFRLINNICSDINSVTTLPLVWIPTPRLRLVSKIAHDGELYRVLKKFTLLYYFLLTLCAQFLRFQRGFVLYRRRVFNSTSRPWLHTIKDVYKPTNIKAKMWM